MCAWERGGLTQTHSFPGFVAESHLSFCLPHTLALRNTRLISNSFLCIAIIKEGLEARFPHGMALRTIPSGPPRNISNQGETISSWHIINHTCRSFPLGRSADTLENKSPDVVLNQRDAVGEAGRSADAFKKWGKWLFWEWCVWREALLHQEAKHGCWLPTPFTSPLLLYFRLSDSN